MKEILTQLLFSVLTICTPLATAYVYKAAAAINASTAEKIKNETIQRICCEITAEDYKRITGDDYDVA